MTVGRAADIIASCDHMTLDVVRPGIWQLTCGDEIDIIGEQQLIDLARSIEDDGA
jgi:hypothetical protein